MTARLRHAALSDGQRPRPCRDSWPTKLRRLPGRVSRTTDGRRRSRINQFTNKVGVAGVAIDVDDHVDQRPMKRELAFALRPPRHLTHGLQRKRVDRRVGMEPRLDERGFDDALSLSVSPDAHPHVTVRLAVTPSHGSALGKAEPAEHRSKVSRFRYLRHAGPDRASFPSAPEGPPGVSFSNAPSAFPGFPCAPPAGPHGYPVLPPLWLERPGRLSSRSTISSAVGHMAQSSRLRGAFPTGNRARDRS